MSKTATPRINKVVRTLSRIQTDIEAALAEARTDESAVYLRAVLFNVREANRDADFARIIERGQ